MNPKLLNDLDSLTAAIQADPDRSPWLDVAEGALRTAQLNLAEHAKTKGRPAAAKPPVNPPANPAAITL